ncbi:unnamed protein product [Allacma fusca]|uniref:CRAL-TRIO domain-containing protein n=1 Tax=Allacma fusca TaxID=39272 RepID=A0A8J2L7C3_9HEXA|nr:unnamed protein product [Allacma fusca]
MNSICSSIVVTIASLGILECVQALAKISLKGDPVTADILQWEAPKSIKTAFPYYHSGYDYDDRPVLVSEIGKWRTRPVVEKGGEDYENLIKYNDQFVERVMSGFFLKNKTSTSSEAVDKSIVFIMDYDGFQPSEYQSVANVKYQFGLNVKLGAVYENMAYGFILNANPFAHHSISISKSYLARLLEKSEILGTNSRRWIPKLLRKIPQNQLHPAYGSTSTCVFTITGLYTMDTILVVNPVKNNFNFDDNKKKPGDLGRTVSILFGSISIALLFVGMKEVVTLSNIFLNSLGSEIESLE